MKGTLFPIELLLLLSQLSFDNSERFLPRYIYTIYSTYHCKKNREIFRIFLSMLFILFNQLCALKTLLIFPFFCTFCQLLNDKLNKGTKKNNVELNENASNFTIIVCLVAVIDLAFQSGQINASMLNCSYNTSFDSINGRYLICTFSHLGKTIHPRRRAHINARLSKLYMQTVQNFKQCKKRELFARF